MRDGDTIISVDQQSASTRFGGIKVFQVDPARKLLSVGRAESASVKGDKVWRLEKYVGTTFARDSLAATVDRDRRARRAHVVVVGVPRSRDRLGAHPPSN